MLLANKSAVDERVSGKRILKLIKKKQETRTNFKLKG
jgi:hypothetical protein